MKLFNNPEETERCLCYIYSENSTNLMIHSNPFHFEGTRPANRPWHRPFDMFHLVQSGGIAIMQTIERANQNTTLVRRVLLVLNTATMTSEMQDSRGSRFYFKSPVYHGYESHKEDTETTHRRGKDAAYAMKSPTPHFNMIFLKPV
jgi:hypothetical protein